MKMRKGISALALSAMVLVASAASAVETGQLLDKGPRWPNKGYRTIGSAECPGPACTAEVINEGVQRGQITPKEAKALRKIQSNPQAATQNSLCGVPYTPPCRSDAAQTARPRGKSGWIIPTIAGLAAVGGILAATGGNGKPKSP